jgi:hypothetical protein
MLAYHEYIYLTHIVFVAPLLIYVGYMKNKANKISLDVMLIIGIVVFFYHLHKLYKSFSYKKEKNIL